MLWKSSSLKQGHKNSKFKNMALWMTASVKKNDNKEPYKIKMIVVVDKIHKHLFYRIKFCLIKHKFVWIFKYLYTFLYLL